MQFQRVAQGLEGQGIIVLILQTFESLMVFGCFRGLGVYGFRG